MAVRGVQVQRRGRSKCRTWTNRRRLDADKHTTAKCAPFGFGVTHKQESQNRCVRLSAAFLRPRLRQPNTSWKFFFFFYPGRSDEKRNEVEGRKINPLRGKKRAVGSKKHLRMCSSKHGNRNIPGGPRRSRDSEKKQTTL